MKRSEWIRSRSSGWMLQRVRAYKLDEPRATRLFVCACGRLIWPQLTDEVGRPSIELSERFADGRADWRDLQAELIRIDRVLYPEAGRLLSRSAADFLMVFDFSIRAAERAAKGVRQLANLLDHVDLEPAQCDLIREIFPDDPRRPEVFDPAWLTPTVVELAQAIHDRSAYDEMPILGDALEEAGCPSPVILDHCRGRSKHVRGCWVVNALIAPDLRKYRPPDYPRAR
jgi:hypothetical protein